MFVLILPLGRTLRSKEGRSLTPPVLGRGAILQNAGALGEGFAGLQGGDMLAHESVFD